MRWVLLAIVGLLATGCAQAPRLASFELIDDRAVAHVGQFDHSSRRMEVRIADRTYIGFYVQPTDLTVATAEYPSWFRRPMPMTQSRSVTISNRAQAHLRSADGEHLACEFLLELQRVVGTCSTPAGRNFQLVAGQ